MRRLFYARWEATQIGAYCICPTEFATTSHAGSRIASANGVRASGMTGGGGKVPGATGGRRRSPG